MPVSVESTGLAEPAPDAGADASPRRSPLWLLIAAPALAFLLLMLATAPAGLASRILAASGAPAELLAVSGRLWRGSGDLRVSGRPLGRLNWDLEPGGLLTGALGGRLQLTAPDLALSGTLALGLDTLTLSDGRGELGEALLDSVLGPYNIDLPGRLHMEDVALTATAGADGMPRLLGAAGGLRWDGGEVGFEIGGRFHRARFPAMEGTLASDGHPPRLSVRSAAGDPLLDVELTEDGWARIRVRYRLIALSGLAWDDPPPADSIALELQEQLFPLAVDE